MAETVRTQLKVLHDAVLALQRELREVRKVQQQTAPEHQDGRVYVTADPPFVKDAVPYQYGKLRTQAKPVESKEIKHVTIFPARNGYSINAVYTDGSRKSFVASANRDELSSVLHDAIMGWPNEKNYEPHSSGEEMF